MCYNLLKEGDKMLKEISIKNFLSFNEKVEFNMIADKRASKLAFNILPNEYNILKSAVIYGPNNTGKTSFINGIEFLKDILLNTQINNYKNHNIFTNSNIIEIKVVFIYNNNEYQYQLKYDDQTKEYIYEEFKENNKKIYEKDPINNQYYCIDKNIQKLLPLLSKNNILIYNIDVEKFPELIIVKKSLLNFANNILIFKMNQTNLNKTIEFLKQDNKYKNKIINFIIKSDLFLENYEYDEDIQISKSINITPKQLDLLKLKSTYKETLVPSILFDSDGTLKMVALSSYIIDAIYNGKILLIDEIDGSLHFKLVREIINMFNNELNTKAQLIATTHDISLLDCKKIFRKEQIWFTSKDDKKTYLYPLSKFTYQKDKIRENTDLIDKYSKGFLGAIPDPDLISILIDDNE